MAAGKNGSSPSPAPSTQHPAPTSRRAEIARAYVGAGNNQAAKQIGVSRQRVSQAMRSLFTVDGLTAACAEGGVDATAVAGVIAEAMSADRTLMLPDGAGGVTPLTVPDHLVRLRAVHLLIDVELKLKMLDQTVETEEVGVRFDGVDLATIGREELTALVMRRTIRRPA